MIHTRTRLPNLCETKNSELAAELRKQWPPTYRTPNLSTAPKHQADHQHAKQTGDHA